jgi:hypothetical protein
MLASQNDRMRAAALSRRILSRTTECSSSAARSAAPTRPCVGETQAVGQRVIPLVRINAKRSTSYQENVFRTDWYYCVQCIMSLTLLVTVGYNINSRKYQGQKIVNHSSPRPFSLSFVYLTAVIQLGRKEARVCNQILWVCARLDKICEVASPALRWGIVAPPK